jgi:lysophospholipase L1-like esterase
MAYLATNIYDADGVRTEWDFSFAGVSPDRVSGTTPYLYPEDVKVQELYRDAEGNPKMVQRSATVIAPTRIRVNGAPIVWGNQVKIYRDTEVRFPLVDYRDGQNVSELDLDLSARQAVFIAQEARDATQNMNVDETGAFNAGGRPITNVADGVADKDAVTVRQLQHAVRAPVGEGGLQSLPFSAQRANKLLSFDSAGQPVVVAAASGSATELALSLADFSSGLKGAGQIGYAANLGYPANTVGAKLNTLTSAVSAATGDGSAKQVRSYLEASSVGNLGNLAVYNQALNSGVVRIAFVGDSIIEGFYDGVYENSTASTIMRILRQQNPGVKFVFGNFSLAGRASTHYGLDTYVGQAVEDITTGFKRPAGADDTALWPGGSVVGKSWMNTVRDFTPDLVFLMFGANDLSGNSGYNVEILRRIIAAQNLWAKKPSVAVAAAALPTTAIYQEPVQISANGVRGFARENNITLIDTNRLYLQATRGVDIDNPIFLRKHNFTQWSTEWSKFPADGLSATPDALVVVGEGMAMRPGLICEDIKISATFNRANIAAQSSGIYYRSLGTGLTQYTAMLTPGGVVLYWGSTPIASYTYAFTGGVDYELTVVNRGCRHIVLLNGREVINQFDYNNVLRGSIGVFMQGGYGVISNLRVYPGNSFTAGRTELTALDTYGPDDFNTNENSLGGNGINHPTKLATSIIWAAGFREFLRHTNDVARGLLSATIGGRATSTYNFAVAGAEATVTTSINGIRGNDTGLLISGTSALATASDVRYVVVTTPGTTTRVQALLTTGGVDTSFCEVDVPLPPGRWCVHAQVHCSKSAAGVVRNTLSLTATKSVPLN